MKYCTQCGKSLHDDAVFCTSCGAKLETVPAFASPPPAYAPPPVAPTPVIPETPIEPEKVPAAFETPAMQPPSPLPPIQPIPQAYEAAPTMPARKARGGASFLNTGLGFILIGILLIAAQGLAFISPMFFNLQNMENLFLSFIPFAAIGFAAVLSSRAMGPDLSIGSVTGLSAVIVALNSASNGSLITGLIIALVVGVVIGFVNGVCTVYLRIPAVIVTLITGFIAYFAGIMITQGQPIMPGISHYDSLAGLAFILLLVTFAIAFLLVLFTRLGKPTYKRDKDAQPISFMFAYAGSAAIAVLAGFFLMLRMGAGMPTMGVNSELPTLFIFAVVYSSRALDNRIAPVLFSLVPAWVWALLSNSLNLLNVNSYTQLIVTSAITLVFVVLAYVCRFERRRLPSLNT
jgi:ribose/xylose/arabinose/galactoside ABC-type transport system permease subunit